MSKSKSLFGYEKLQIWQRGMALWERLQRVTSSFPDDEKFGLASQIRRAACSVPANISEGYGKGTNKAFAAMVRHSRGSVYELRTLIEGARRFDYIGLDEASELHGELVEISKMIDGFLKSLERSQVKEPDAVYESGNVTAPATSFETADF